MDDISSNNLETVRRNLTVMPFMIVLFDIADGKLTNGLFKLGIINVEFEQPIYLFFALIGLIIWYQVRYFQLGAYREFKKNFIFELNLLLNNDKKLKEKIKKHISKKIEIKIAEKDNSKLIRLKSIEFNGLSSFYTEYTSQQGGMSHDQKTLTITTEDKLLRILKYKCILGSITTFILPIISSLFGLFSALTMFYTYKTTYF